MNEVLNREWKDAFKELGPPMIETANTIVENVISNFASKVSLDDWFPEKL